MKKFVGRLLAGTDIYPAVRAIYRKLNARSRKAREYELDFYRAIIKPGDLVFDIGANVGFKTEAFVACGARVICVEPNPKCLPILLHEFGSVAEVEQAIQRIVCSCYSRNVSPPIVLDVYPCGTRRGG